MADFSPIRRKPVAGSFRPNQANAGAFAAPFQALQQVGQGIQQASSAWQQVLERKQQLKDYRMGAENQRTIEAATEEFRFELEKAPDRSQFPKLYEGYKKRVSKALNTKGMTPEARAQIEERWKSVSEKARFTMEVEDFKRERQQAQSVALDESEIALQQGDMKAAKAALRSAFDNRAFTQAEYDAQVKRLDHRMSQAEVAREIQTNAHAAVKMLNDRTPKGAYRNFKHLSEAERRSFLSTARTEANRKEIDFHNHVVKSVQIEGLSQDERDIMWEEAKVFNAKGILSDAHMIGIHNTLFKKDNLPDWGPTVQKLHQRVMEINIVPNVYTDEEKDLRRDISLSKIAGSEKGRLMSILDGRMKGPGVPTNGIDYKESHRYIDQLLRDGALGKKVDPLDIDKFTPSDEAYQMHLDLQRLILKTFQEDSTATAESVRQRIDLMRSRGMDTNAIPTFTPDAGRYSPQPGPTASQVDNILERLNQ